MSSQQLQTPPKNGNLLGSGSYGKVYMVNNLAKKIMDYKYDDGNVHDKNLNEIAFLSTYRNIPFLPKYNSVEIKGDKINLLMEFCGMNLEKYAMSKTYIERIKMIPSLLKQFSIMLQWMKNQKIAHVDIKPTNICIDKDGNLKLIDWGFVTYLSKNYNTKIYGTEYFADPNTIVSGKLTRNYDIYSVGMTLCWFLTKSYQNDDWTTMIENMKDKNVTKEEINNDNIYAFLGEYIKESIKNTIDNGNLYYELLCRMIDVNINKRITPEELCNILDISEQLNYPLEYHSERNLSKQSYITNNNIATLVEWLINIKIEYKLYSSLDYSIDLLYKVLKIHPININELQLLGICCLLISSYANTNDILDVEEAKYLCKDTYTIQQIENTIKNIYILLDFKVYPTYTLEGLSNNLDYDIWHRLYLKTENGKLTMRDDTFDILDRFKEMCNLKIIDNKVYLKNKKILVELKSQLKKKGEIIKTITYFLKLIDNGKFYDSILKLSINLFKYIIKHKQIVSRTEFTNFRKVLYEKYYGILDSIKQNKTRGNKHKKSKSNEYYYNKLIILKNDINF